MKRSSLSLTAVAACLSIACLPWSPSSLAADDPFPVRPVTIVNPNAPGGFVDIVARGLAASMQRQLRQPVLVVNRPGANAAIGTLALGCTYGAGRREDEASAHSMASSLTLLNTLSVVDAQSVRGGGVRAAHDGA